MGNCYSIDHTAEDHIHIDITYTTKEQQQKYRHRTVTNRLAGWGLIKHVLPDPNLRPQLLQWFETFGPYEGFLTHQ